MDDVFHAPHSAHPFRRQRSLRDGGDALTAWSWKLGAIAGISIYLHASFLLLLAWLAVGALLRGDDARAMGESFLLITCVFGLVLLHELGHALTGKRFGVRTRDITLLPIGGVARVEQMPARPLHELFIALAGPAVNGVLALLFLALGASTGEASLASKIMWINVSLALFNLLPAFPMDGGRVLRALLAMRWPRPRATRIAASVGKAVAVLLGFVGLFANPLLTVIAVFVWSGARSEVWAEQVKAAIDGICVQRAMVHEIAVVGVRDTLGLAAEHARGGFQRDFPVVDGGRVVGVLTHAALVKGLMAYGPSAPVEQVMERELVTAKPEEPLEHVLSRLPASRTGVVIVVDHQHLVGMLTAERVGEMLAVEGALHVPRTA